MNTDKIILGTVQFGIDYGINNRLGRPQPQTVFNILDYAFDHGVTTLDSAFAYGEALSLIGQYHSRSGRTFKVNSKFKGDEEISVASQLNQTLNKAEIERVETFFYHRFEDSVKPKIQSELSFFKHKNLIKKIGVSIYSNNEFEAAIENQIIDVIQIPYNMFDNYSKRGSLMKLAKERGKEVQARSVFLQGLFFMDLNMFPERLAPLIPYLQTVRALSLNKNASVGTVALWYAIGQPLIDNVLIGVEKMEQLKANLDDLSIPVDNYLIESLDKINVVEENLLNPQNWS